MPEVVRGVRASVDSPRGITSPNSLHRVAFAPDVLDVPPSPIEKTGTPLSPTPSTGSRRRSLQRRRSDDPRTREERDAYYDSRAATQKEFRRRASTLQDYYKERPDLLPQLPFTMHHGWRRWRLWLLIFLVFVDACVIPLVLYYGLAFGANVQGWIIFAIVTTVWGGPTYLEFAIRSWRLSITKNHFYRPLGSSSRWAADITNWVFVLTITVVTALFVIGSAPHTVWLRVLSMPAPALLYTLGGCLFIQTMWSWSGRPAPFRVSSTPKGGKVYPGVYYYIEDIIAVNAAAGRPFREALMARYEASPGFQRMIWNQSLFWSVPALAIAITLTPIICAHTISDPVVYGLGWGIPFLWAICWAPISIYWVKRDLRLEREAWETDRSVEAPKLSMPTPHRNNRPATNGSTVLPDPAKGEAPSTSDDSRGRDTESVPATNGVSPEAVKAEAGEANGVVPEVVREQEAPTNQV